MLNFELNKQVGAPVGEVWINRVLKAFTNAHPFKKKYYFSLALVDQRTIRQLNRHYRGRDQVTDILSFAEDFKNFVDLPRGAKYLGEIVICVPETKKQARLFGQSFRVEFSRLLIHGLAHLVGYDHEGVTEKEAQKMFAFEGQVMKKLFPKRDLN